MASTNFRRYLPHLYIVAAFYLVSIIYSYPALSGKELNQGDNVSWKGMSHEAAQEFERTGKPVLWSNSMFSGMPTYTFFTGRTNNFVVYVERAVQAVLPKPAYFLFIALVCFYMLMQVMGVNRWLSAVGALAYAFSTYNPIIIAAGHDTKMLSLGYMPGVIAGILLIYRGRYLPGMAMAALLFTLMALNMHVQIIFYMGIILVALGIGMFFILLREQQMKRFFIASALSALSIGLGFGPSLFAYLTTAEYAPLTMRGGTSELTFNHDKSKKTGGLDKEYAFRWSNSIGETFCLMVPYLYGGASGEDASHAPATADATGGRAEQLPTYWGPQPYLSGPVYFGAAICFLFVLGMIVIRSPHKWWMGAVSLLAIIMSWGNHFADFNYFLFDHVPQLNKFRTPSMVLVIPQLLFPLIGVWAVQDVLRNYSSAPEREKLWKSVRLAAGITAGLALLLGVGGSLFFDFTNSVNDAQYKEILPYLKEDRAAMARNSGILSAVFILATAGLLWAYLTNKIKTQYLVAGIGMIVAIDLVPVAWRYLNDKNYVEPDQYAEHFTPRPVDAQIMKDPDPYYRVLDLSRDLYNDANQAYFHKCIGGYNPAKMEIYQDLIDVHMNVAAQSFNTQVLNMLNTKYIIVNAGQSGLQAIPNPDACGNAWFVSEVKPVATADQEMVSLNAAKFGDTVKARPGDFDPKQTAVVRNNFGSYVQGLQPGKDPSAIVRLAKYGLNEISYASSNPREGLAVFSDIWYPYGWTAYVDGKPTPIIRADYVLRAVRLPAGQHQIVFKFHPQKFYTGNTIAGISSVLIYLLVFAGIFSAFRSNQREDEANEAAADTKNNKPAK